MNFSKVCRTCLRTETLYPIFKNGDDHDQNSNDFYMATGVQVDINDNLPQNLCLGCLNTINNTLKFRKQCKNVETELLRISSGLKVKSDLDIQKSTTVLNQHRVKNTSLSPKIDSNNVLNIKEEEIIDNAILSTLKSNEFEHDINKANMSLRENSLSHIFYNAHDNDMKIEDIEMKNRQAILSRKMIEKVNLRNISLNETVNTNDNDTNTEDIEMKTTKKIKTKRKSTIKPHKKATNSENEMVESAKLVELPYNVLPGEKYGKITRVVCKMCAKELSIRSIDSHMARCHPGADTRKVKCELCDNHILKEKLNRHIVMMHGSSYRCGYCKSEFNDQPLLVEHVQKCTAKKRKASKSGREMTECDECHQKMQKASLRMHKATKHAGLRPVCEHCGRSFGNKLRLSEHYRAKHGYDKFRCGHCPFASASIAAMRNHERRHRGETPFVCELCGAKFHAAYLLAQHRHSHRTERTVKCDLCPASFKANNSLHMHRMACHGARVYTCGLCARAYRCRHYALRHLRLVHRHTGGKPPLHTGPNDDT